MQQSLLSFFKPPSPPSSSSSASSSSNVSPILPIEEIDQSSYADLSVDMSHAELDRMVRAELHKSKELREKLLRKDRETPSQDSACSEDSHACSDSMAVDSDKEADIDDERTVESMEVDHDDPDPPSRKKPCASSSSNVSPISFGEEIDQTFCAEAAAAGDNQASVGHAHGLPLARGARLPGRGLFSSLIELLDDINKRGRDAFVEHLANNPTMYRSIRVISQKRKEGEKEGRR